MANPEPKEQNLCTVAVTPKTFRHSVLSLGFARSGPNLQNPSHEDGTGNGRKQSFVHKEILIQVRFPLIGQITLKQFFFSFFFFCLKANTDHSFVQNEKHNNKKTQGPCSSQNERFVRKQR